MRSLWKRIRGNGGFVKETKKDKQPETFKMCAREFIEKKPDAKIKIKKSGTYGLPLQLANVPVNTFEEYLDSPEEYLRANWGGGDYIIDFFNDDNIVVATYRFGVFGPSKTKEKGEGEGKPQNQNQMLTLAFGMIDKLMEGITKGGGSTDIDKIVTVADKLSARENPNEKLFENIYNNFMSMISANMSGDRLDDALKMIEVSKALQPEIHPEDTTTALITALSPLLAQIAGKMMGGGGNANIDLAKALQDPRIQQMLASPEIQSQLAALGGTPNPQQSSQSSVPMASPGSQATQTPQREEPEIDPGEAQEAMIDTFRRAIKEQAPPQKLADMLVAMIKKAETVPRDLVHPVLISLTHQRNPGALLREFQRFCGAIPELRDNESVSESIKEALIAEYTGIRSENQKTGEPESQAFHEPEITSVTDHEIPPERINTENPEHESIGRSEDSESAWQDDDESDDDTV